MSDLSQTSPAGEAVTRGFMSENGPCLLINLMYVLSTELRLNQREYRPTEQVDPSSPIRQDNWVNILTNS